MEQGFRYEKDCLSKKERTTCIGNGNSGENPKRFNVKRAGKNRYGVPRFSTEIGKNRYGVPRFALTSPNKVLYILK